MLEHFKDTPNYIFKTCFFSILIKKCTWPKQIANINVIVICLTYCGSTKCSQPVWGPSYQCIYYFGCKKAVNSYFSLMLHIYTGAVGKKINKQYIPYREFFLTLCLFLSMIDMYRSLALLCI